MSVIPAEARVACNGAPFANQEMESGLPRISEIRDPRYRPDDLFRP
jgi:hypothetical protein